MNNLNELLHQLGIVPVVKLDKASDAIPLAEALISGGIPCAEVTFRTEAAAESIRLISEEFPEMLVGAGTVLTIKQVDEAIKNGAKFIVTPGLNPKVVQYCIDKNIPIYPGVSSASDIERALELGLNVVKFFPAEINGGINAINALSGPYPNLKFIPTGGVNLNNMADYLNSDKILACGGTWMVKDELIKSGDFKSVEKLSKDAVKRMIDLKVKHISLKTDNKKESDLLAALFEEQYISSNDSSTLDFITFSNKNTLTISTSNLKRAQYVFEQKGIELSEINNDQLILKDSVFGYTLEIVRE